MWNADYTIQGAKIMLRALRMDDAQLIVRWRNQPFVKRNLYTQTDLTVQQHEAWYQTRVATGDCAQFVIVPLATGAPVGTVFLKNIDNVSHKAEYGIFIGEEGAQGQGYGSEAASLMLRYGFEELSLHRIYLTVFRDNEAGFRSYRKAGFAEEGVLRDDFLRYDGYADVVMMAVLRDDWEKRE